MNAGTQPTPSEHGLLTTALYQMGKDAPRVYALEGAGGPTLRSDPCPRCAMFCTCA
jgi:hypothetical protein